jgi:ankyrin repeat protein
MGYACSSFDRGDRDPSGSWSSPRSPSTRAPARAPRLPHEVAFAASDGDVAVVVAALDAGLDVDAADAGGRTLLHHALASRPPRVPARTQRALVALLLERGAAPDARDAQGRTPLHIAAQRHELGSVELLLFHGAEVDVEDALGHTPLFRAAVEARGRDDVMRVLVAAGADPHRPNRNGVSPADLAAAAVRLGRRMRGSDGPRRL